MLPDDPPEIVGRDLSRYPEIIRRGPFKVGQYAFKVFKAVPGEEAQAYGPVFELIVFLKNCWSRREKEIIFQAFVKIFGDYVEGMDDSIGYPPIIGYVVMESVKGSGNIPKHRIIPVPPDILDDGPVDEFFYIRG